MIGRSGFDNQADKNWPALSSYRQYKRQDSLRRNVCGPWLLLPVRGGGG
jgi:hypothetical protein